MGFIGKHGFLLSPLSLRSATRISAISGLKSKRWSIFGNIILPSYMPLRGTKQRHIVYPFQQFTVRAKLREIASFFAMLKKSATISCIRVIRG